MNRRTFLVTAAAASASVASSKLSGAGLSVPAGATQKPTNVLFVLADQWRFSAFSHGGDPVVATPNFDRLAERGARFTRTYAANPVCTPNRSCILTGRYSHQHGMIFNDIMLPPREHTIAEVFSAAGYATHYIGKLHIDGKEMPGFVPPGWRRRSFQTFEGFNRGHWYPAGAQYFDNDGHLLKPDVYEPTYQTDLAIDFMKRNRNHPFFCFLSWGPPHQPYRPSKEWDIYDPAKLDFRPNVPAEVRNDPRSRKWMAGYYGSCSALDHEMGRLVRFLDENGLADNTLLVFTSDHGDMLGSHGLYYKEKPEEESLHIPLYISMPGYIQAKQSISTLVSSIDLTPTILSLCGLRPHAGVTGKDLSGALFGREPKVDFIYAQGAMTAGKPRSIDGSYGVMGGKEWRAFVTPTHKIVQTIDDKTVALFDLEKDPYEMKNLVGERSAATLGKNMLAQMRRWAKEVDDPFPQLSQPAKPIYTDEEAAQARS